MKPTILVLAILLLSSWVFASTEECYSGWVYCYSSTTQQGECTVTSRVWCCPDTGATTVCGQYVDCNDSRGSYEIECQLDY